MLQKAGFSWDEIDIYHHPKTNIHLGIARVILRSSKQLKPCIEKFNNKSVMGKVKINRRKTSKFSLTISLILEHNSISRSIRRTMSKFS